MININIFNFSRSTPKRQKAGVGLAIIFVILGILFNVPLVITYKNYQISKDWPKVDGYITDVKTELVGDSDGGYDTEYASTIIYTVDNVEYQTTSTSYASASVGGTETLVYNPSDPNASMSPVDSESFAIAGAFSLIGILAAASGVIFSIKSLKRTKAIKSLQASGNKIRGIITDLRLIGKANGRSTYRVVVAGAGDSNGAVRSFISDTFYGSMALSALNLQNNPIAVDVYIDSTNPNSYYVDFTQIPNPTLNDVADIVKNAVGIGEPASEQSHIAALPGDPSIVIESEIIPAQSQTKSQKDNTQGNSPITF